MSEEPFLDIPCGNYANIDLLIPDKEFSSRLEKEIKNYEEELQREPTNQELAGFTLSKFHKLYRKSPDFGKYKELRRKGQKSENTSIRRKLMKIELLKKEKEELLGEIKLFANAITSDQG